MKSLIILSLLFSPVLVAHWAPPQLILEAHQQGDPFADWMNTLTIPGVDPSSNPGSCCGAAPSHPDCRVMDDADVRSSEGRYSVRDTETGKWLPVEPGRVSNRMDNPTGHFVACIHQHMGVMCFFNRAGI